MFSNCNIISETIGDSMWNGLLYGYETISGFGYNLLVCTFMEENRIRTCPTPKRVSVYTKNMNRIFEAEPISDYYETTSVLGKPDRCRTLTIKISMLTEYYEKHIEGTEFMEMIKNGIRCTKGRIKNESGRYDNFVILDI